MLQLKSKVTLAGVLASLMLVMLPATSQAGPGGCRRSGFNAATAFRLLNVGYSARNTKVNLYNFDFGTPTCARRNNVEWPVDLLFYNNATESSIVNGLSDTFPYGKPFTSTEYARINDGNGWFWAHNRGRKSAAESAGTSDDHYRIYAYSQRSYSDQLGYFVIGTMHRDFNEAAGVTNASYGDSEDAETDLAADASIVSGWTVYRNNYNMENRIYGQQGNHIWQNDGLATMIRMPS